MREADRVLMLHRGRIVAEGTHAELVETGELYVDMCAQRQFEHVA